VVVAGSLPKSQQLQGLAWWPHTPCFCLPACLSTCNIACLLNFPHALYECLSCLTHEPLTTQLCVMLSQNSTKPSTCLNGKPCLAPCSTPGPRPCLLELPTVWDHWCRAAKCCCQHAAVSSCSGSSSGGGGSGDGWQRQQQGGSAAQPELHAEAEQPHLCEG